MYTLDLFFSCRGSAFLILCLLGTELRTLNGAISVQLRLAVALRILAGASYLDVAVMFGLGLPTVYKTLWMVIDAINDTEEIGPFFFPTQEFDCRGHAARYKARACSCVYGVP